MEENKKTDSKKNENYLKNKLKVNQSNQISSADSSINKAKDKRYPSLNLTGEEMIDVVLQALIVAGGISVAFLVLYFAYQEILAYTGGENFRWPLSLWIINNPHIYEYSINLLIAVYMITLIAGVTWALIRYRDRMILISIRQYISQMARGDYNLRIPEDEAGDYERLARDVNILMDNINQAFEERKETERMKDEFMRNIGHDIRTPLTSIKGYIDLVRTNYENLNQEQIIDYISIAYEKTQSMEVLINDMFDYTDSSKRTVQLDIQDIPLEAFIQQITADFSLQAEEKGIEIQTDIKPPNLTGSFDPEKMARTINNLMTNALKYGKGASYIDIKAYSLTKEEFINQTQSKDYKEENNNHTRNWLIIEVANNGPLLSKKDLDKIFERSYRADQSRTSKEPGSGLGLSIVKNFVELHHGNTYAYIKENDLIFRIEIPQRNA